MDPASKISPAFRAFLAESGPNDKCDGIVIYRAPAPTEVPPRARLLEIRKRLAHVRARASAQGKVETKLFDQFGKIGKKSLPGRDQLAVSTIGRRTLPVATVQVTRNTLPALAAQPDVVAIMPNQKIHLIRPTEVDYEVLIRQEASDGLTWGLKQLRIPEMWKHTNGAGITVGVMDTGVYAEHSALAGRVAGFTVIDPLGRRVETKLAFDSGNHGTHVCGTIAGGKTPDGVSIGVAPGVSLVVAAVLIGDSTLQTLLEGISWAVEKGANILSMSLGFSYYEPYFPLVFEDLLNLYGVVSVAAIGNENHGNSSSPGNAYNALSVGAVEKMPGGKVEVAPFSSGASLVFPGSEPTGLVTKPDVVAPGVQVYSSVPPENRKDGLFEYSYMDGTSMATPHVAGVMSLLMAAKPKAPVVDIIRAVKETAKHPGSSMNRPDNRWGYGLIQPLEALKALG
jgi:subtilisin family serine protease